MKKILILISFMVLLSSCGTTALYYWGGGEKREATTYEKLSYNDYKTQTPDAVCKLICAYEDIVSHPGGTRRVPPPGICAEYGYLLLQPATAQVFLENATSSQKRVFDKTEDFTATFSERGKEMLQKEMEYYPESRQFIEPLIRKLVR